MCDLISRQKAIKAIEAIPNLDVRYVQAIEELPSAQPEISRIEQELHGKTPEEQYDFIYWLLLKFALAYTDSRLAVVEWLGGEKEDVRSFSCGQENDLISRQAAIDACLKGKTEGLPATNVACDCCAERIRVLPSAQPEPYEDAVHAAYKHGKSKGIKKGLGMLKDAQPERRWIPCSETVDIPDHEILACDKYGEEMFGYLAYEDEQWLCESDGCVMYDPIAWSEKPEPYRGEGEKK